MPQVKLLNMKIKFKGLIIIAFLSSACMRNKPPDEISIIPKPVKMELREGFYKLNKETMIIADEDVMETAGYLRDFLKQHAGLELSVTDNKKVNKNSISLSKADKSIKDEGYYLKVSKKGIDIKASENSGLFYGIQTLRSLLPAEIEKADVDKDLTWTIPCVNIEDYPLHKWRGFMLDCSRHIFDTEFIKKLLDMMAARKMNIFHWHLTDSQGWRIEIEKYPKLTEIAAWRVKRDPENWDNYLPPQPGEAADYGGFYTKDQIREIIEYARVRNITIVPEIDMPGHSTAVFAAYPHLSCSGKQLDVPPGRARIKNFFSSMPELKIPPEEAMDANFCMGNDSVFIFLEDVLSEVIELFPSEYIHFGSDEVYKRSWEICPKCQKLIKDKNFTSEEDLMIYFINHINGFLKSKGRKGIFWYEKDFLECDLDSSTATMVWHRIHLHDYSAVKKGIPVIMAPSSHTYINSYQGAFHFEPFAIMGNYLPIDTVYSFKPVSDALSQEEAEYIMGGEACLWTEFITTSDQAELKIFPRIEALSEVLWTPDQYRDSDDFKQRLKKQIKRYEFSGINFSPLVFLVNPTVTYDQESDMINISLRSELNMGDIYYTIDGSDPEINGILYEAPFRSDKDLIIKAVQIKDNKSLSAVNTVEIAFNKAIGAGIRPGQSHNHPYMGRRDNRQAINGIYASYEPRDWEWIGYKNTKTIQFTIDLGKTVSIDSLKISFLNMPENNVFIPDNVEYYLSDDGDDFIKTAEAFPMVNNADREMICRFPVAVGKEAAYVKIIANFDAKNNKRQQKNNDIWMLTDEIIIK